MTGKITKNAANADKFKRLFDKGYIISEDNSEYVNMVVCDRNEETLKAAMPAPSEILKQCGDEFDKAIFDLEKAQFPVHMHEFCRWWNSNCLSDQNLVAYVLTQLVAEGKLNPLTDGQKHSVNTIMFCDVLPK